MKIKNIRKEHVGSFVTCDCWTCHTSTLRLRQPFEIISIPETGLGIIAKTKTGSLVNLSSNSHNFKLVEDETASFDIDIY